MLLCIGTFDIFVHLLDFQNLALQSRGIYAIKISINRGERSNSSATYNPYHDFAVPYLYFSKPSTLRSNVNGTLVDACLNPEKLKQAEILEDESAFRTRFFVIRYRDESVDINEGIRFQFVASEEIKIEEDKQPFSNIQDLILNVDLVKADLNDDQMNILMEESPMIEEISNVSSFPTVASQSFKIRSLSNLQEMIPINFSSNDFVSLGATIFCSMINMKFVPATRPGMASSEPSHQSKIDEILSGHLIEDEALNKEDIAIDGNLINNDSTTLLKRQKSNADKLHSIYVGYLVKSLYSIIKLREWIWDKCLDAKQGHDLNEKLQKDHAINSGTKRMLMILDSICICLASPSIINYLKENKVRRQSSDEILSKSPYLATSSSRSCAKKNIFKAICMDLYQNTNSIDFDTLGASLGKKFSEKIDDFTPANMLDVMRHDLFCVATECYSQWTRVTSALPLATQKAIPHFKKRWIENLRQRWHELIYIRVNRKNSIIKHQSIMTSSFANDIRKQLEEKLSRQSENPSLIEDISGPYMNTNEIPICIFEKYESTSTIEDFASKYETITISDEMVKEINTDGSGGVEENIIIEGMATIKPKIPEIELMVKGETKKYYFINREEQCLDAKEYVMKHIENGEATTTNIHPVLSSDETYSKERSEHLIVIVHGYKASSGDMTLVKGLLSVIFPNATVYIPDCFDSLNMDQISLKKMAETLSIHLRRHIIRHHPTLASRSGEGKISFIGHSMGGLLIRAALATKNLSIILNKLHSYVSFSTPHCGNIFGTSKVFDTGMWAFKYWRKSIVLEELMLNDKADESQDGNNNNNNNDSSSRKMHYENTFLYKLSQNKVLSHFKHVIFVSSHQDKYVPLHSARVEVCDQAENRPEDPMSAALIEMVGNIISGQDVSKIVKLEIDSFVKNSISVDAMIGRAAHISYLDNPKLLQLIFFALYFYLADVD